MVFPGVRAGDFDQGWRILPSLCDRNWSHIQTKKKTHKRRRHIKHFIISPQKEYKRGTGVTGLLKIVFSRGNCRIYHKKTCENNSSSNKKSKDSLRNTFGRVVFAEQAWKTAKIYLMAGEYKVRAGGSRLWEAAASGVIERGQRLQPGAATTCAPAAGSLPLREDTALREGDKQEPGAGRAALGA